MLVKLTIDLARGFAPWKQMFHENEATFNAHGCALVFAGADKEDDNKLTVLFHANSLESLKAFATDEELKQKRADAGALHDTTVVTIMSEESFTKTN